MIRIRPHALAPGGLLLGLALLPALPGAALAADACTTTNLKAGQSIDTGNINVCNDDTTLTVTYEASDPWCVLKTNLHAATTAQDIPQNRVRIPTPGQFDYGDEHYCDSQVSFDIDLEEIGDGISPGEDVVIAAHAEVRNTTTGKDEAAWGEGTRFVERGNWGMYFMYTLAEMPLTTVCACDDRTTQSGIAGAQILLLLFPAGELSEGAIYNSDNNETRIQSLTYHEILYMVSRTFPEEGYFCVLQERAETIWTATPIDDQQFEACRTHLRISCGQQLP
jgi:hypothetical protein